MTIRLLLKKFQLYYFTIKHLKFIQIYSRLLFRFTLPKADLAVAPKFFHCHRKQALPISKRQSLLTKDTFFFLGVHGSLSETGWDDPQIEKLWRYNQHYFDDLNAQEADRRRDWHLPLLQGWVRNNPPTTGTGWEPYPTSLRIVNWVKWHWAGNSLPQECLHSLAIQARWLSKRLEWHILGNHLFVNAKALVFAGLAFAGPEADRWLMTGLSIIQRQLPEQVLADGGNFERSPMYHALFLEDVLDLINAASACPGRVDDHLQNQWRQVAKPMLGWLRGMVHPDGEISLFNDAAFSIAPCLADLTCYANRLGLTEENHHDSATSTLKLLRFPDSGYIRLESSKAVALLDVAPIGPDYLPGHAHADTLSYELSLFGQRVIVNGGTSRYGTGPERLRERQTCSHSTVEVDGESSSEVWGGFRVARRAYPFDLSVRALSESVTIACSHDGYRRLPGKPVHRREWRMHSHGLEVLDQVTGHHRFAVSRTILHPDISIAAISPNEFQLNLATGESVQVQIHVGQGRVEQDWYAPEFGKVLSTQCLVVELINGQSHVHLSWT